MVVGGGGVGGILGEEEVGDAKHALQQHRHALTPLRRTWRLGHSGIWFASKLVRRGENQPRAAHSQGCPRAMAPPLGLTFSQSSGKPKARAPLGTAP